MKNRILAIALFTLLMPLSMMAQTKDIVETVTVGDGTSSNYLTPFQINWEYSTTQQIYTAEEIGIKGTIGKIAFYQTYGQTTISSIKIYMKHVTRNSFSSDSDFERMTAEDLVYSGSYNTVGANQWATINLTTEFVYNGTDNLLICCVKDNGTYVQNGYNYKWRYTTTSGRNATIYKNSSSNNINPTTNNITGTRNTYHPNIQIGFSAVSSCTAPSELQSTTTTNSATLSWTENGNATEWSLQYKEASATEWTTVTVASDDLVNEEYTLGNLSPDTEYAWQVAAICSANETSAYTIGTNFSTQATCPAPTNLSATPADVTATLNWDIEENEDWVLQYKATTATDWTTTQINISDLTNGSYLLEGLNPTTEYQWQLAVDCGNNDISRYTIGANFTTDCGYITNFPWSEDFESLTGNNYPIPECWDNSKGTNVSAYNRWCYNTNSSYGATCNGTGHNNTKCVRFNSYTQTSGNNNYLQTPIIVLPSGGKVNLSFWYKNPSGGDLSVYISTNGGTTTTALANGLTGQNSWAEKVISLESYAGNNVVILFKGTSNYGNGDANIYLDDVSFSIESTQKTFVIAGNWNEENNWSDGTTPTIEDDVVIAAAATIPNGCTATANNITIEGGSITIVEGGQLQHNNSGVIATMQKNITAYSDVKDNYYLMALPFESYTVENSPLVTGTYDLYTFDGSQESQEWQIRPATITNGTGFLYANNVGGLLSLEGTLVASANAFTLRYTDQTAFGTWNLVGNPFACNATPDFTDFYVIGGENNDEVVLAEQATVAPLEGIFVRSTATTQSITFTKGTLSNEAKAININLTKANTRNANVIDRARIRFDEGENLEKFQLNPNHTKLSVTEGNQDYAMVRSSNASEMPVSFKAETNGRYAISIEKENVELSYLHLIDNMTGADIDLLSTPSYTFDANTTDYESRFRLVFNATGVGENNATANFAYFNGSSWIVSNPSTGSATSEATLQVLDVMGRTLSTQTISSNAEVSLNQAAGVYMLRLVNGEKVMVQKVVVR